MSAPPESSVFDQLFQAAWKEYERQTGTSLIGHQLALQLQTCDSVESVSAILGEQAQAFREFRGHDRHGKLMKSIKTVVHVLHMIFTSRIFPVGQGIGSISFPPANITFAAIGILLSAVKDVSASYDALLRLFESIGNFLKRLETYTKIPPTTAITDIVVKILTELLSALALATKEVKQGQLRKLGRKLLGDSEIEAVLQRMDGLTQDEGLATSAQTLKVVYGLDETVQGIKRGECQEKIRTWLSPPDPWENHNIACEVDQKSTATWFIQGDTFSEWKSSGPFLWIHGKPGAGKSILCATIINNVDTMRKSGPASLAFFYCDFRHEKKKDRRDLLSSLLVQLSDQSDSYCGILSNFYSAHDGGSRHPSDHELTQCLKDMLKCTGQPPIYIIIDGLDECPNISGRPSPREMVVTLVEELVALHLPNLHICITSRPEADIEAVLNPLTSHSVSLHNEAGQNQDIIDYITSVVDNDPKMRRWRADDKEVVIRTLSLKANGMFRWVSCQLDYLRHCFPGRIMHALDELPETLDGTYERTLQDIHETYWKYAHNLFQAVTVASRPLRVEELAEFLAFDFEARPVPKLCEGWRLPDPEQAVLSTCSSLISVVDVGHSRVVQFSHFSVKEFLTSSRLAMGRPIISRYHVLITSAHTVVAQACLSTLLHLDETVSEDSLESSPLAQYAAEHCVHHAKFAPPDTQVGMKLLFDPNKPHFKVWTWIYDLVDPWRLRFRSKTPSQPRRTPLHYAAQEGIGNIVEFLLVECSQDVNARCVSDNWTPLLMAVRRGHLEVTQILIQHGADVNARDINNSTPLPVTGRPEIAQVLLERGADANVHDKSNSTALHVASEKGRLEIAKILLDHGVDANIRGFHNRTPLHYAVEYGHLELAQILLERGADANLRSNGGWTPLHSASYHGHLEVALVLLERGADANARDETNQTPLRSASHNGHLEVARVLLEFGADANACDETNQTPLHWASLYGHLKVALALLESGADANARDKTNRTPLHSASHYAHLETVRTLLECGADANACDNDNWTPLHSASLFGQLEVAQALLERGADADARDKNGRPPLHLASQSGHLEVSRVLLEWGADADIRDNNNWTPLHSASMFGHLEVTRILLERGVDADSRDKWDQIPLQLASQSGHLDIARVLLEHGTDANRRDCCGDTLLHWASKSRCLVVIRVLLEDGADVNARNKNNSTPLHVAIQEGHLEVVQTLLEQDADPNVRDNDNWTPLHWASQGDYLDIAQALLEQGADANSQDKDNRTALHSASREGSSEVTRLLLEHGADANTQDDDKCTPLHWASQEGHPDVVQVLLEKGADANVGDNDNRTPLHWAFEGGCPDITRILLEQGADPNSWDDDKWAPLHWASQGGQLEVAQALLEHGAHVNARDKNNRTALHWASKEGHREVTRALLEHGAEAKIRDDNNRTPLHLASRKGYLELVQLLLQCGADIHVKNDKDQTPFHEASGGGHRDVMRLLSEHEDQEYRV